MVWGWVARDYGRDASTCYSRLSHLSGIVPALLSTSNVCSVYGVGMLPSDIDLTNSQHLEGLRRSLAMLNIGAPALNREEALRVVEALKRCHRSGAGPG